MKLQRCIRIVLLFISCSPVFSQTGTYQRQDKTGLFSTIAITRESSKTMASVFGWWGNESGQNGNFDGAANLKNDIAVFKGSPDDPCSVTIRFKTNSLYATFSDCIASNLPDDFNGIYSKITNIVPGVYKVKPNRSFFYTKPDIRTKRKSYIVKGNTVILELENFRPGGWIFVNYANKGKTTGGYMRLADLQL